MKNQLGKLFSIFSPSEASYLDIVISFLFLLLLCIVLRVFVQYIVARWKRKDGIGGLVSKLILLWFIWMSISILSVFQGGILAIFVNGGMSLLAVVVLWTGVSILAPKSNAKKANEAMAKSDEMMFRRGFK